MASRQNRKKKGRANQQNRERTVTTLTEDPNTPFLVPTPSEEPAGPNMSSPFSVSSSSGGNVPNGNYQVSTNFGYSGPYNSNYMGTVQHGSNVHQHQPQQLYQQQLALPDGSNDMEILEKLKAQIKAGQHDRFQPIPQPNALLNVYQEGLQEVRYAQQGAADYQGAGFNQIGYDVGSATGDTGTKTALSTDSNQAGNRYGAHKNNVTATLIKPENDLQSAPDLKVSATASAGSDISQPPHGRFGSNNTDPRGQDTDNQKNDHRRPPGDSPVTGEYGSRPRALSDASPVKTLYDDRGDARNGRDLAWQPRDDPPAQDDKRGRPEPDRSGPPSGRPNSNPDSRSNGNDADARGPMPRDPRFYDRERYRDRDRDQERDRERDWNRDRDRDRRPDYRRDDRPRMTDARRPPPEQRHYEPQYSSDLPRRVDNRPPVDDVMDVDRRPLPPTARPGPIDDRPIRPLDDRVPPRSAPPARVPHIDDRHTRPPPGDNRHPSSPEARNLRTAPPPQPIQDVPPRTGAPDRIVRGPPPPMDDRNTRPAVPLEDRIGRGPPSLQERITHPPPPRTDDRIARQPSLEERISHAPTVANDRPIPHDDRAVRPSTADRNARPVEPIRPPIQEERLGRPDDRSVRPGPPVDRYVRPGTPPQDRVLPRGAGYTAVPRSASVARDDPRALRTPPSPPPTRDYRPTRALSRDRDLRAPHRPEIDRPYDADRRPDLMDVDSPARFNDNRPPYQRRLSPPPADRARSVYPPPPSPPRAEPPYADLDRRYAGGDRRDYPFEGRQRQLSGPEDDSYLKSRPASWDRVTLDKDRVDRGVPPIRNHGWETHEDRERRTSFPGSPSTRSFDPPQQRPLGSRLTDSYSGPGDDRTYPPRELERSRYPPAPVEGAAPFSRVRPRSPSPNTRRPGPGNVIDDGRPPMKRVREDPPYSAAYYSPDPRRPGVAGGPNDYPPRAAPTPRPEGGAAYYDNRAGPPPPSGGRTGPPYDRDYPVARDRAPDPGSYVSGPSSYDRPPRSPPPSRLPPPPYRGNYTRGGDLRDDRAYNNMPPPPRTS